MSDRPSPSLPPLPAHPLVYGSILDLIGDTPILEISRLGNESPRAALDFIAAHPTPAIFHLKDFHEPLRETPETRRRLRDLYESCRDRRKFIVISSPVRAIPEEVERNLLFLELRPPDVIELADFLRDEIPGAGPGEATLQQMAPDALLFRFLTRN